MSRRARFRWTVGPVSGMAFRTMLPAQADFGEGPGSESRKLTVAVAEQAGLQGIGLKLPLSF